MASVIRSRREFLFIAGTAITGFTLPAQQRSEAAKSEKGEEDVAPSEDLMREHGVLRRVLLIYDEYVRRAGAGRDFDPAPLEKAANIVSRFVQDYHEKQEENYIFPRLKKANKLADLVNVLLQQHAAGRVVTQMTITLARSSELKAPDGKKRLAELLGEFTTMYRPHAAREDTVLFPGFRSVVSAHEYEALGGEFEKNEKRMFGEGGFEKFVDEVAGIERALGIYDLSQFTPKTK